VILRAERPSDLPSIYAVHAASFPTDAEARLVNRLRSAGRLSLSLVAEVDELAVGHIAFSPVTVALCASAASQTSGAGLAPVAVLEAYRRRGIAAKLIRAGLVTCQAAGFGWAVVLGEPTYYARFGFRPAVDFGLFDEYGGGAAFQALELVPGSLPINGGLVRYGPEFAEFA
jgi:putative acetyltransferase